MKQLLQIAQLGASVLRRKAKKVTSVAAPDVQKLIDNLIATCKETDGVGIAAPQVYQPLQICIIASTPNVRYPRAPRMKPLAVINPKIITQSKRTEKDWEGCLSIPGIRGLVPRHTWVDVSFTDRKGNNVKKRYKGFVARIFQHEYDHLQGILFIDRLETNFDIISEKEYQKMMR